MPPAFALTSLMLGNFATGLAVLAPAGMLVDLARGLNVGIADAGLLITVGAIVLGVGAPLTAWLTSRFERRNLLAFTLAVLVVTNVASAFAPNFATLLALRVVMLAVGVIFTPQAAGVVGQMVPVDKRAAGIAYAFLGWSLVAAVGLPVVTLIASAYGFRAAYLFAGAVPFASLVLLWMRLPRGLPGSPVDFGTWVALAKNPLILLLLAVTMLQIAGQFVLFPFIGPLLQHFVGARPEVIGAVFAAYGIGGFIGNVIATRIVGRLGGFVTSVIFTSCLVIGTAIWALGAGVFMVMAIGVAIWGFGFAATNSMQQARLVGAVPAAGAAAVALNTSSLYLGQAMGSAIGSALFVRDAYVLMGFVACGLIACAVLTILPTRPKPASH